MVYIKAISILFLFNEGGFRKATEPFGFFRKTIVFGGFFGSGFFGSRIVEYEGNCLFHVISLPADKISKDNYDDYALKRSIWRRQSARVKNGRDT